MNAFSDTVMIITNSNKLLISDFGFSGPEAISKQQG